MQNEQRLQPHKERFNKEIEELIAEMDTSHRCVSGMSSGLGVIKLKNGRRAEIQLHINTDKNEWIKGK